MKEGRKRGKKRTRENKLSQNNKMALVTSHLSITVNIN